MGEIVASRTITPVMAAPTVLLGHALPPADSPDMLAALAALRLPFLRQWLQHSVAGHTITLAADDLPSPLERAWSDTLGWPADAAHPWAALAAQSRHDLPCAPPGAAWAFVRLCHWHVGNGQFTLMEAGPIQAHESDTLLSAMRPYFEEDGIALYPHQPGLWLACSPLFSGLASASVARVMGLPIEPWLPGAHLPALPPAIRTLRRLQNEMQMLLYPHPVNESRPRPVNSIWFEGCGHLGDATPAPHATPVVTLDDLREPWLLRDAAGWAQAWARLDADVLPALLEPAGARIAWCGQRQARWWCHQAPGTWQRVQRLLKPVTPAEVLTCDA
jgi:hypothetical protein